MAIKKRYSSNQAECKVTFILAKEFADNFHTICLVGDFNNWNHDKNIFTETEADGSHSATIILPTNTSFQFRYLADGVHWFNEADADSEVESYFEGFKNSVIIL